MLADHPAVMPTSDATEAPQPTSAEPQPLAPEPATSGPRITIDVVMRVVTVAGREIDLTPKEFDLLSLFAQNPGRPFSRDELLDRIWRNDYEVTDRHDRHARAAAAKEAGRAIGGHPDGLGRRLQVSDRIAPSASGAGRAKA